MTEERRKIFIGPENWEEEPEEPEAASQPGRTEEAGVASPADPAEEVDLTGPSGPADQAAGTAGVSPTDRPVASPAQVAGARRAEAGQAESRRPEAGSRESQPTGAGSAEAPTERKAYDQATWADMTRQRQRGERATKTSSKRAKTAQKKGKKRHWVRNLLIIILIVLLAFFIVSYIMTSRATDKFQVQFGDKITYYAEKYGLDPNMVAGTVRAESDFRETVVADDGGMGLMQLMPETAKWCAGKMGIEYKEDALLTADYNLDMGCFYMSWLFQKYQSQSLAEAAYNAGPGAVDEWLSQGLISREEESLKNIPYDITRAYVPRVNMAKRVYGIFYPQGLPTSTTEGKGAHVFSNWKHLMAWAFAW